MKFKALKPYKVDYRGAEIFFPMNAVVEVPDELGLKLTSNPRVSRFLVKVT